MSPQLLADAIATHDYTAFNRGEIQAISLQALEGNLHPYITPGQPLAGALQPGHDSEAVLQEITLTNGESRRQLSELKPLDRLHWIRIGSHWPSNITCAEAQRECPSCEGSGELTADGLDGSYVRCRCGTCDGDGETENITNGEYSEMPGVYCDYQHVITDTHGLILEVVA